jgi:homoserine kinase
MSVVSTVTVSVPATTANLGPGFDCIGAALTLYNQFRFTRLDGNTPLQERKHSKLALQLRVLKLNEWIQVLITWRTKLF